MVTVALGMISIETELQHFSIHENVSIVYMMHTCYNVTVAMV